MKTIEITVTAAQKAYQEAPVEFKPTLATLLGPEATKDTRPVIERIKTLDDVFAYHSTNKYEFLAGVKSAGLTPDEEGYRLCKLIAAALNEGWTPDWNDGNQPKWFPYMEWTGSGFSFGFSDYYRLVSSVGSRLCFKSRELSDHYGREFTGHINQFFL